MRKFYKVSNASPSTTLPTRSDAGSAGYDFYTPEDIFVEPNGFVNVATNIKAQMEQDEVLFLFARSSMGIKRHIALTNSTAVIDSTYFNNPNNEGNIIVGLRNLDGEPKLIKAGERICQGVFVKYLTTVDDNPINSQRLGGIGSSGK